MKRWTKAVGTLSLAVAAGAGVALAARALRWRRTTREAIARLNAHAGGTTPDAFSFEEIVHLPAPVQRYFRFVLAPGVKPVRRASIVQEGLFRAGGLDATWSPFTAHQVFTAEPPGFLWDARIHMAPLTVVQVRDSYISGEGAMQASICGAIPVVDQSGTPELAAGALHRYLAEIVWMPTALLPRLGVVWEAVDETHARATLSDGGISVSLVFEFGYRGEIVSAYTPERFRDVDGAPVPTPWICHYSSYKCIHGTMIPTKGEAAWMLPEGILTVARILLRAVRFDDELESALPAAVRPLLCIQELLHNGPRLEYGAEPHVPLAPSRDLATFISASGREG